VESPEEVGHEEKPKPEALRGKEEWEEAAAPMVLDADGDEEERLRAERRARWQKTVTLYRDKGDEEPSSLQPSPQKQEPPPEPSVSSSDPSSQPPLSAPVDVNKLAAKALKAKLMKDTKTYERLQKEIEEAKKLAEVCGICPAIGEATVKDKLMIFFLVDRSKRHRARLTRVIGKEMVGVERSKSDESSMHWIVMAALSIWRGMLNCDVKTSGLVHVRGRSRATKSGHRMLIWRSW